MFKRIQIFFIFLSCAQTIFYAQERPVNQKYWSGGFNIGMIGWSPSYLKASRSTHLHRTANFGIGDLSDVDGKHHPAIIANTSIGLHAGFMWQDKRKPNYTSIQVEFQKNKACYSYNEPFHYTYNGDTVGLWVDADSYLKYSVSLTRTFNPARDQFNNDACWYAKLSFGQTFEHRNFNVNAGEGYEEDWTQNGTGKKLKIISANKTSWMVSPEIGRRFVFDNNTMVDLGIVYHAPFVNTRVVEYEYFKNNISLGKSTITYAGSTIMLNLAYTFNYHIKKRPVDSTKVKRFNELAVDSTEIKHHEAKFHHHKINGRKFNVQSTLTVLSNEVKILVWDKNRVDGDEISLYLNGEPILENYTVSKTKKEIIVKLNPGSNIIVMHALNLGRVPPNTAALNINDGNKKINVTLVSDLHKSGAVEIIYNP